MIKSIYRFAAEYGLILGLILTVMWFCAALSLKIPALSVVSMFIFFAVPYLIYRWMRSTYRSYKLQLSFSALWMEGICMFLFGCIIMSGAIFVFMRYIEPGFIVKELMTASDFYAEAGGSMAEISDIIDKMIASGQVPTPINVAVEFIWLGVFSGSLLSMIVAFIVKKTTKH